jgi:tetratricopeptide (TPR) repeat protein
MNPGDRSVPNRVSASETAPDRAAVTGELARLGASNCFRKAERCLRLLRHLTNLTLDGRSGELKEYSLGVTVLDRPEDYDPRTDPVVRLEARRLRLKLAEYYQDEGLDDPVIIELPKGGYVPEFRWRSMPEATAGPTPLLPTRRMLPIWLGIAVVLIAISLAGWFRFRRNSAGLPVRASIAVLGFQDLSSQPESAWISAAVSELMNIDLSAEQRLRTLPLENVARMRTELSLTPQAAYPVLLMQRVHANLGSDYVVAGSYLQRRPGIHLDVMLFDARSGQQVAAIGDESAEDALPELVRRCAGRIRAQLGVRLPVGGQQSFQASAMEPYAKGMEHLRQGDALSARTYLEKAVASAPSNALCHSGLAAAWSALGLDIRAGQEAKLALDASADLSRVEQLEIEGRYRNMAHDWPRAIQVYQALFTLLPDDLEYGLLLGSAQTRGGQGQEALKTVQALRSLPAPLGDDPRVDMAEAQAAGAVSDFARTQKAAQSAAEKAKSRGAQLQYAKARLLEAGAMQNLGMAGFQEMRAEARGICAELGDRACVAAAYRIEANQLVGMGDLRGARRLYQSVLDTANEIGNSLEQLNALNGLAYAAELQGDLPAAERYERSALTVASEIGPQKRYPVCLELGNVLAQSGRLAEARSFIEQALQGSRQSGDRESAGLSQAAEARTLALEGKSAGAIAEYNQAVAVLREVNEPFELSETLLDLGDTQLDQGDLAAARKSFEDSRTAARSLPTGMGQPEIELAWARLSFAEDHFADAASQARLALTAFTSSGREGHRYEAAAVLSRALIRTGRADEAAAVLAQFQSPDVKKFPTQSVVQFEIARCIVLAHDGRRGDAMRVMNATVALAASRAIPKLERDAREAKSALQRNVY